ncbi:Rep protein [Kurthia massiliensis]|uniref:Rep protein n=1 Tax=Kurthia massiliensis TaxID=1033739 RepID=UPI000288A9AA
MKDSDIIKGDRVTLTNIETVVHLDKALAYKRLISYGGILKEIHKELDLSDAENGN